MEEYDHMVLTMSSPRWSQHDGFPDWESLSNDKSSVDGGQSQMTAGSRGEATW